MEWVRDKETYRYVSSPGSHYLCAYRFGKCWVWKAFLPGEVVGEGHSCSVEEAMAEAERFYFKCKDPTIFGVGIARSVAIRSVSADH